MVLFGVVASMVIAAGNVTEAGRRPAPRAVIPYTTFKFGDIYRGEVISQIFVIKNEGDADLQIKDFVASCGCQLVRSDKVIAPGKEGTATIEVETISQSGEIYKSATMQTNDPNLPSIVFTLVANVLQGAPLRRGKFIGPIFVSPDSFLALYAPAGKKITGRVSITADDAPVKVLRVEGGTNHFSTRVEVVEPGRSYNIVIESLPTETAGLYREQIHVITDNLLLPAFPIEAALRVTPKQ